MYMYYFKIFFSFIDFRERGRKGGREKKTWICCSTYLFTHWLTLNMCSDWGSNLQQAYQDSGLIELPVGAVLLFKTKAYFKFFYTLYFVLHVFYHDCELPLRNEIKLWLVWFSGSSAGLQSKGLLIRFLVRAHAWVAGQVPNWGHARGNHTLMLLSLSLSYPFSKDK